MHKGVRVALVFVVIAFCLFQALFIMYESAFFSEKVQGKAVQGIITLCIGYPPNITYACPEAINQSTAIVDNTLRCQMQAISRANSSLNFSYSKFNISGLIFSMNNSGFITIWGNQTGIGRYLVPITITDNASGCRFSNLYNYYFNITDINDPPYLKSSIPDKQMSSGSSIAAYFLNDYFGDPDPIDVLSYTVTGSSLSITIDPDTSQVLITAPLTLCEKQVVMFTAKDPGNLTTNSNAVTIDSVCAQNKPVGGGGGSMNIACEPKWECKEWSRCFINETRFKTCVDMHGCNPYDLKKDFWENCTYVPTCYDGVQNQNELGVDCGGPCPACAAVEENKTITPTCQDGIKNQGELGVDCGGPCPACKQIEVPGLLPEKYSNDLLTTSIIIVVSFGALTMGYFIFRKEIKSMFAKFVWWLTRKRRKQILLSDEQKEELLDSLKVIETKLRKGEGQIKTSDKSFQEILKLNRLYLNYALELPFTFYDEELATSLSRAKNSNLINALKIFVQRQLELEKEKSVLNHGYLFYYLQELRQLILNTSNYAKTDYNFLAKELVVTGAPMERCTALLYNAILALAFNNVEDAKSSYLELLKIYETLNDAEKTKVYSEVAKLFSYINYVLSWVKKK